MLLIKDSIPSTDVHQFKLTKVNLDDKISFELTSETYPGVTINFTLEYSKCKIPTGYSVSVHLFKNNFFSQKDINDLRLKEIKNTNGKVGYFFRLDALFEKDVLEINQHTYPYAYYALEHIFSSDVSYQTRDVEFLSNPLNITDFFDEDTIVLVLCNEYINEVNTFSIDNYLAPLFLKGFIKFDSSNRVEIFNEIDLIEDSISELKKILRPDGVFVLRLKSPIELLTNESFITYLYQNLLLHKNETITRFIILYQIIEISISKIFHIKVQSKVCDKIGTLTSLQLKKFLSEIQTEKNRIVSLLNEFSRPTVTLDTKLRDTILDFFIYIQDPDYSDSVENSKLTLADVFYDYRNKLVHNYRLIHTPDIDNSNTQSKMELINNLTEVLISQIISNFKIV